MQKNKHGEVSWTDTSFDNTEKKSGKDLFLRLSAGSNVIRLLTLPYLYYQHRWLPQNGKKYGYRVNCSGATGSCPLCEMGEKAKKRWLVGVIDRKSGMYKVLDIGYGVYKDIQVFARDEDWGDPTMSYDLDIVCDPTAPPNSYYSVVSKPKKVIASDIKVKEENNPEEDLMRRTTPPTSEKVKERVDAIMSEIKAETGVDHSGALNGALEKSDDNSDDNFFRNYDTKQASPF